MEGDEKVAGVRTPQSQLPPWQSEGTDLSRVLALSDGIFAFAMTLLVLGLALPAGFQPSRIGAALVTLRPAFLVYLLSFAVIFFYWLAHHQLFEYITSYDRRLVDLNVAFLLFIAVMPFVTNLLAAASGEFLAAAAYAVTQIAAGSSLALVWAYASHHHRHVDAAMPDEWIRYIRLRSVMTPAVFAASIPIAAWNPGYGEYAWLTVFVLQVVLRHRARSA